MAEKITPRAKDYSEWYLDIVQQAGLPENSRACTADMKYLPRAMGLSGVHSDA